MCFPLHWHIRKALIGCLNKCSVVQLLTLQGSKHFDLLCFVCWLYKLLKWYHVFWGGHVSGINSINKYTQTYGLLQMHSMYSNDLVHHDIVCLSYKTYVYARYKKNWHSSGLLSGMYLPLPIYEL